MKDLNYWRKVISSTQVPFDHEIKEKLDKSNTAFINHLVQSGLERSLVVAKLIGGTDSRTLNIDERMYIVSYILDLENFTNT